MIVMNIFGTDVGSYSPSHIFIPNCSKLEIDRGDSPRSKFALTTPVISTLSTFADKFLVTSAGRFPLSPLPFSGWNVGAVSYVNLHHGGNVRLERRFCRAWQTAHNTFHACFYGATTVCWRRDISRFSRGHIRAHMRACANTHARIHRENVRKSERLVATRTDRQLCIPDCRYTYKKFPGFTSYGICRSILHFLRLTFLTPTNATLCGKYVRPLRRNGGSFGAKRARDPGK